MMTVKEYAQDTGHSIAEILKKCNELGINVKSGDDDLSEDDIIILDNTINLISTNVETDYEDEDALDESVEDLVESNNLEKTFKLIDVLNLYNDFDNMKIPNNKAIYLEKRTKI